MEKVVLKKDGSNWSSVVNANNFNKVLFECGANKVIILEKKKAHYTWDGKRKEGAECELKIEFNGQKLTVKTAKLKEMLGIEKETKSGTKKRTPSEKFADLWAQILDLDLPADLAKVRSAMNETKEKESAKVEKAAAAAEIKRLEALLKAAKAKL